jgi:hypothetical protein
MVTWTLDTHIEEHKEEELYRVVERVPRAKRLSK